MINKLFSKKLFGLLILLILLFSQICVCQIKFENEPEFRFNKLDTLLIDKIDSAYKIKSNYDFEICVTITASVYPRIHIFFLQCKSNKWSARFFSKSLDMQQGSFVEIKPIKK